MLISLERNNIFQHYYICNKTLCGESQPQLGVNPIIDAVTLLHYTNIKKYKYTIVGNRTKMHSSSEEFVPPVQTSSPRVGLFLLLVPCAAVSDSK